MALYGHEQAIIVSYFRFHFLEVHVLVFKRSIFEEKVLYLVNNYRYSRYRLVLCAIIKNVVLGDERSLGNKIENTSGNNKKKLVSVLRGFSLR